MLLGSIHLKPDQEITEVSILLKGNYCCFMKISENKKICTCKKNTSSGDEPGTIHTKEEDCFSRIWIEPEMIFLPGKNKSKEIYWFITFKTRHYPVHGKKHHVIVSKVRAVHGSSPRQKCSNYSTTNSTSLVREFRKPCVCTHDWEGPHIASSFII